MLRKLEEEEAGFIAQAANDYAALAAVHAVENGKTMEEILVRPLPSQLFIAHSRRESSHERQCERQSEEKRPPHGVHA
jgi:hypothetical protein